MTMQTKIVVKIQERRPTTVPRYLLIKLVPLPVQPEMPTYRPTHTQTENIVIVDLIALGQLPQLVIDCKLTLLSPRRWHVQPNIQHQYLPQVQPIQFPQ